MHSGLTSNQCHIPPTPVRRNADPEIQRWNNRIERLKQTVERLDREDAERENESKVRAAKKRDIYAEQRQLTADLERRQVHLATIRHHDAAAKIIAEVAGRHRVSVAQMMAKTRLPHVVAARHEAIYKVWLALGLSTPVLGKMFGGRHYTSIMHAIRKLGCKGFRDLPESK